jgi:hypothetical protein
MKIEELSGWLFQKQRVKHDFSGGTGYERNV